MWDLSYIGHSDGGGVQDLALAQQIKDRVHQVSILSVRNRPLYQGLSLTSLQRLTRVPDTSLFTRHLLNTTYSLWATTWLNATNAASTPACWICLPLARTSYIGIPVPPDWSPDNNTSPNNVTYTLGPIAAQIPVASAPNYTYVVSPRVTSWGKLQPSLCAHNLSVPWGTPYCASPGIFLLCNGLVFHCIDFNLSDLCIQIFLTPEASLYLTLSWRPGPPHTHQKCVAAAPFLLLAGIFAGVATGTAGPGSSVSFYHRLSQELNDDMDRVADSFATLQFQLNCLAAVALQNRQALDLLTAKKGGTCLFLGEECCYFVNQSGIVTAKGCELHDRIQKRRDDLHGSWGLNPSSWPSWLLPLAGPLLTILLATIGPCIVNAVIRFIETSISRRATAQIPALRGYRPLSQYDDLQVVTTYDHQRGSMMGKLT